MLLKLKKLDIKKGRQYESCFAKFDQNLPQPQ